MMILPALLLLQSATGTAAIDCWEANATKYSRSTEAAPVVVKVVRTSCHTQEEALIDEAVQELRKQNYTASTTEARKVIERRVSEGADARILKLVMDARLKP